MAARTRKILHDDKTRLKIQASQLINRLQDSVLKKNESDKEPAELTSNQLKAIEILLRKSLPDLSSVELTGADGKDLIPEKIEIEHVSPKAPTT